MHQMDIEIRCSCPHVVEIEEAEEPRTLRFSTSISPRLKLDSVLHTLSLNHVIRVVFKKQDRYAGFGPSRRSLLIN